MIWLIFLIVLGIMQYFLCLNSKFVQLWVWSNSSYQERYGLLAFFELWFKMSIFCFHLLNLFRNFHLCVSLGIGRRTIRIILRIFRCSWHSTVNYVLLDYRSAIFVAHSFSPLLFLRALNWCIIMRKHVVVTEALLVWLFRILEPYKASPSD